MRKRPRVKVRQLVVPVVKLGQALEFIIDAKTLALIEERKVEGLADTVSKQIAVAEGQRVSTVQATAPDGKTYTLAWTTLPPNRDLPQPAIPAATDLVLLQGLSAQ